MHEFGMQSQCKMGGAHMLSALNSEHDRQTEATTTRDNWQSKHNKMRTSCKNFTKLETDSRLKQSLRVC